VYYSTLGGVRTTKTNLGPASPIAGVAQPVLIPADAVPTHINHQLAYVHATCVVGTKTYLSYPYGVTVVGVGPKSPTTTSTTTTTTTTTSPVAVTTTTTAPVHTTSKATVTVVAPAAAGTTTTTVHAAATASATATTSPSEELATTGIDIGALLAIGGSLVVAGGLLLTYDAMRRRRERQGLQRR
jgi:hypothetical protein